MANHAWEHPGVYAFISMNVQQSKRSFEKAKDLIVGSVRVDSHYRQITMHDGTRFMFLVPTGMEAHLCGNSVERFYIDEIDRLTDRQARQVEDQLYRMDFPTIIGVHTNEKTERKDFEIREMQHFGAPRHD